MSELIIESHKNATITVLRSVCEQQRHTTWTKHGSHKTTWLNSSRNI